ncbi:MAG: 16S rRNA (cytidine(1402)-2'-O)-methyltransferase [Hahellaceae bacterium]|nr:16S rRNA (cytidine(1402)-2'-O)-methyltransferase [Hahellaceae bacterium]MCP5169845.1 16S rRNA (cytidine(1402)-2'-O)-methyltransferase [Hahellaceae bacterium]
MTLPPGLYVVATPIGNMKDMTTRAVETLASVDCIAAEDTRHTRRLLQHFGISKPLVSLHDHNEREKSAMLVNRISEGQSIALVSDAGTPLISDPGYFLVKSLRESGCLVSPIPGPCALIAALSASGLPNDRFAFEGFLPAKSVGRKAVLMQLLNEARTLIFYESPHRILDTLNDFYQVFGGDRTMVIGRELTKTFETVLTGSIEFVLQCVAEDANQQKGEFVILVQGAEAKSQEGGEEVGLNKDVLLRALLKEVPVKTASRIAAEVTGLSKNELYERALILQGKRNDRI